MNLPNKLTIIRIAIIPLFMAFSVPFSETLIHSPALSGISQGLTAFNGFISGSGWWLSGTIFVVAFITDALDGYIARKYQMITDFGKFLDPIADKLLVTAAFFALVEQQKLSSWIAVIIISREFIVTGVRLLASSKGVVIAAGNLGKIKTILQTIALTLMLFRNFYIEFFATIHLDDIFMFAALVLTIISGVDYILKNKHLLMD